MSVAPETRLFGTVERRLFRATAVLSCLVALAALIAGIAWVLGLTLSFFYALVMPLSVTGILALVLYPIVDCLEKRTWLNRLGASSLVVLIFIGLLAAFVVLVVPALIREVVLFAEMVPSLLMRWEESMSTSFPAFMRTVSESAQDGEINKAIPGLANTGENMKSFAGILAGLSFVPLLLFFALLSGGRLHGNIASALSIFKSATQKKIMYFLDVFRSQVTGFFQGQLVIALIMGSLFAVGFTLIDLKGGILIGLSLGLLNIVPFLGTLIGLLIVLPLAYLQPSGGGFQLLGLSLLVFTVVQLVESWLLTPKIMANRSGLHPALVVISVFFWGTAFGSITGMILAVPLTAFFIAAWRQAKAGLARSMTSERDAGRIERAAGSKWELRAKPSREERNLD